MYQVSGYLLGTVHFICLLHFLKYNFQEVLDTMDIVCPGHLGEDKREKRVHGGSKKKAFSQISAVTPISMEIRMCAMENVCKWRKEVGFVLWFKFPI